MSDVPDVPRNQRGPQRPRQSQPRLLRGQGIELAMFLAAVVVIALGMWFFRFRP